MGNFSPILSYERVFLDSAPLARNYSFARVWTTVLSIGLCDLITLSGIFWLCSLIRPEFHVYAKIYPFLLLAFPFFSSAGLYAGVGISPVEELRRASVASTLVYGVMFAATYLIPDFDQPSRAVLVAAWVLTLILLPACRALTRLLCCKSSRWGYTTLIVGSGSAGQEVARMLKRHPELGLRPFGLVRETREPEPAIPEVPVLDSFEMASAMADNFGIRHAIIAMPDAPRVAMFKVLERYGQRFPHLLVIPDLNGAFCLSALPKNLGGVFGLEIQQKLLMRAPQAAKRVLDAVLTLIGGLFILPLMGVIALIVKLDSPGPAFYGQTRIGRDGRRFKAWKFRSMVKNADQVLEKYLTAHPELREEWERDHKLKDDPRITPLGHFLRRTSLDELPQVWNVFKREMSWVGPRPIVSREVSRYGSNYTLYAKVLPGITGMWQISGRNDTTYEERVQLDTYYVRNWSIWLDLYVLSRTISAVLSRKGAY